MTLGPMQNGQKTPYLLQFSDSDVCRVSMSQDGEKGKERRSLRTVCPDCGTDVMHWIHFAAAGYFLFLSLYF